jgi:hypothetical protein
MRVVCAVVLLLGVRVAGQQGAANGEWWLNTSPPLVSHDLIVVPTSLENGRTPKSMKYTKDDILAFDVRTGRKVG